MGVGILLGCLSDSSISPRVRIHRILTGTTRRRYRTDTCRRGSIVVESHSNDLDYCGGMSADKPRTAHRGAVAAHPAPGRAGLRGPGRRNAWRRWPSGCPGSPGCRADQRASVLLITQAGVAGFTAWLRDPTGALRPTDRRVPGRAARAVPLDQPAADGGAGPHRDRGVRAASCPSSRRTRTSASLLTEDALRYGREVAFTAATVYAAAAEARGAWDARLEALVVDGIVRGDAEESLMSRAAALGWDPAAPATVLVGAAPPDDSPEVVTEVRARRRRWAAGPARRAGHPAGRRAWPDRPSGPPQAASRAGRR